MGLKFFRKKKAKQPLSEEQVPAFRVGQDPIPRVRKPSFAELPALSRFSSINIFNRPPLQTESARSSELLGDSTTLVSASGHDKDFRRSDLTLPHASESFLDIPKESVDGHSSVYGPIPDKSNWGLKARSKDGHTKHVENTGFLVTSVRKVSRVSSDQTPSVSGASPAPQATTLPTPPPVPLIHSFQAPHTQTGPAVGVRNRKSSISSQVSSAQVYDRSHSPTISVEAFRLAASNRSKSSLLQESHRFEPARPSSRVSTPDHALYPPRPFFSDSDQKNRFSADSFESAQSFSKSKALTTTNSSSSIPQSLDNYKEYEGGESNFILSQQRPSRRSTNVQPKSLSSPSNQTNGTRNHFSINVDNEEDSSDDEAPLSVLATRNRSDLSLARNTPRLSIDPEQVMSDIEVLDQPKRRSPESLQTMGSPRPISAFEISASPPPSRHTRQHSNPVHLPSLTGLNKASKDSLAPPPAFGAQPGSPSSSGSGSGVEKSTRFDLSRESKRISAAPAAGGNPFGLVDRGRTVSLNGSNVPLKSVLKKGSSNSSNNELNRMRARHRSEAMEAEKLGRELNGKEMEEDEVPLSGLRQRAESMGQMRNSGLFSFGPLPPMPQMDFNSRLGFAPPGVDPYLYASLPMDQKMSLHQRAEQMLQMMHQASLQAKAESVIGYDSGSSARGSGRSRSRVESNDSASSLGLGSARNSVLLTGMPGMPMSNLGMGPMAAQNFYGFMPTGHLPPFAPPPSASQQFFSGGSGDAFRGQTMSLGREGGKRMSRGSASSLGITQVRPSNRRESSLGL